MLQKRYHLIIRHVADPMPSLNPSVTILLVDSQTRLPIFDGIALCEYMEDLISMIQNQYKDDVKVFRPKPIVEATRN